MNLLLLILAIVPHDSVVRDRVDVIELNHHYNEEGFLLYEQVIFRDWSDFYREYVIVATLTINDPANQHARYPRQDRGRWYCIWETNDWVCGDPANFVYYPRFYWREVTANQYRETWTQGSGLDPEIVESRSYYREWRRGLTPPKPAY